MPDRRRGEPTGAEPTEKNSARAEIGDPPMLLRFQLLPVVGGVPMENWTVGNKAMGYKQESHTQQKKVCKCMYTCTNLHTHTTCVNLQTCFTTTKSVSRKYMEKLTAEILMSICVTCSKQVLLT